MFLICRLFQKGISSFVLFIMSKKRLRLSKQIIDYDVDVLFDFLNETLNYLLEDIKAGFEDIFVKNKFVFSIIQIKLKNIAFKLLPFKIFNDFFFRYRGSRSPRKCNFCTRFYVEEIDQAMFIEKNFRIYHYSIQHTNVLKLLSQKKTKSFSLNL